MYYLKLSKKYLKKLQCIVEFDRWFESYSVHDFARSGTVASSTVELDEGPLIQFSHSIEPHLRRLGLPVALKKGLICFFLIFCVVRF